MPVSLLKLWVVRPGLSQLYMWIGIVKAGYSFGDELPIFLLIYLLPLAGAAFVVVKWKLF